MNKGASVAKLYSYTVPLKSDLLNTYCVLQKGFTDQFVYYRKDRPQRYLGLGRCIAIASREDLDHVLQGEVALPTVMFSFNRFDASNPKPADEMMQAFPRLRLMIPEVVLIENEQGCFLQVNSLGPVYKGRVERFLRHANDAPMRERRSIRYSVVPDSYEAWEEEMRSTLSLIKAGACEEARAFATPGGCGNRSVLTKGCAAEPHRWEGAGHGVLVSLWRCLLLRMHAGVARAQARLPS